MLQQTLLWASRGCPSLQDAVRLKHSLVLEETLSTAWHIWACPNGHSQASPLGFATKISLPKGDNLASNPCLSREASLRDGPQSGTRAAYRGAVQACGSQVGFTLRSPRATCLGDAAHSGCSTFGGICRVPRSSANTGARRLAASPRSAARRGCCSDISSHAASSGRADPGSSQGSVSEHSTKGAFISSADFYLGASAEP